MGLDQNWVIKKDGEHEEMFFYHRKVPALEKYMATVWHSQGNDCEFNCEYLEITHDILDNLERCCEDKCLDGDASGFFWGSHADSDYEEILAAIELARTKLNEGHQVYYTSWW